MAEHYRNFHLEDPLWELIITLPGSFIDDLKDFCNADEVTFRQAILEGLWLLKHRASLVELNRVYKSHSTTQLHTILETVLDPIFNRSTPAAGPSFLMTK